MPTYRTNALYQAPTVDNAVYEQFGMQPGMDRLNLLPRHDAKLGWIAPNALYQIARALVSPSVAAQGGYVSPEDGVNFAGNVSLGSLGTSALMKRPAPGPGKTVSMAVDRKAPLPGLSLNTELTASYSGQKNFTTVAKIDGKSVGKLDWVYFGGEPSISMIEVAPEFRRKGIGSALIDAIRSQYPSAKIDPGDYATPDGQAFIKSIGLAERPQ